MKTKRLFPLLAIALLAASCHNDFIPRPIYPETDMFDTWYTTHHQMYDHSSVLLRVNELLVEGDTLSAQQLLANHHLVAHGLDHPLDTVGTCWTVFTTSSRDTLFTLTRTAPDVLTYSVHCTEDSEYHYDQEHYGCGTHYDVRLTHIAPGTYLANGGGYINTDGSADLTFEMQDIRMGGKWDGHLTLRGYAHRYDSTVVYHYTFYDHLIVCDETQREVW